jgi:hypothetical protein
MNEPAAEPPVLTDQGALSFPDGPPLLPLSFLQHDDLFMPGPAEFLTVHSTSDWILPGFQEDQSVQTRAIFGICLTHA